METHVTAAIGYLLQFVALATIAAIFVLKWSNRRTYSFLALSSISIAVSGAVLALVSLGYLRVGAITVFAEYGRGVASAVALLAILRTQDSSRRFEKFGLRIGLPVIAVAAALLIVYTIGIFDSLFVALITSGGVVIAWTIIVLAEQIYRNLPYDSRSGVKYYCAALLVTSVYDIVFFLHTMSLGTFDADFWAARGYIYVFLAPSLWLYSAQGLEVQKTDAPARADTYSLSPVLVGGSILLWLIAQHYVTQLSGSWASAGQIVFLAAVALAILTLSLSTTVRARTRVLLTKVFLRYKYDYRKEWLRFIGVLSESELENVPRTAVRAVAPIVNSPGGIVWTQQSKDADYLPVGAWRCDRTAGRIIGRDSSLIRFLRDRQWVVDLRELAEHPKRYDDLELDPWFRERDDFWLVVPLLIGKRLLGLIVLLRPQIVPTLNFEDHDLLRTVGRHVGTHIRQAESDRRLAESSQFSTYHRLTAFLMHDLNNLIAQQSLVVKNAEKFRDNPQFVDDTIDTIAHSVARMRRLMEQLSRDSSEPMSTRVRVRDIIENAVRRSESRLPSPTLDFDCDDDVQLYADPERLSVIVEHLIRNAQDATDVDGDIEIRTGLEDGVVEIKIVDSGRGMSAEFIDERLFRPFDSTKGSQSMGIGAYQAREYVRMLGGYLDVRSKPGEGTTFVLHIPAATDEQSP